MTHRLLMKPINNLNQVSSRPNMIEYVLPQGAIQSTGRRIQDGIFVFIYDVMACLIIIASVTIVII
jgi:hypothetical protein